MKKVVLIFGIIMGVLVSCSTDDTAYEQDTNKANLFKENTSDFCVTCRDSIIKNNEVTNDSTYNEIDPVKPKKD